MPVPTVPRAVALFAVALAACASPTEVDLLRDAPYLSGPVAAVTVASPERAELLVQPGPESNEQCGIRVSTTARTRVVRREPQGGFGRATLADVRVGGEVAVYVTGAIADSCPALGEAAALVLLPTSAP